MNHVAWHSLVWASTNMPSLSLSSKGQGCAHQTLGYNILLFCTITNCGLPQREENNSKEKGKRFLFACQCNVMRMRVWCDRDVPLARAGPLTANLAVAVKCCPLTNWRAEDKFEGPMKASLISIIPNLDSPWLSMTCSSTSALPPKTSSLKPEIFDSRANRTSSGNSRRSLPSPAAGLCAAPRSSPSNVSACSWNSNRSSHSSMDSFISSLFSSMRRARSSCTSASE
mmetsp:Transcript_9036/g.25741  ORF Transcript_9036/g.25741 Transcript_9036/m.25741 type:complete len:227 (-) Transcript_9036:285-965(-)